MLRELFTALYIGCKIQNKEETYKVMRRALDFILNVMERH